MSWGRSPGGLVTAMDAVMRDRGGAWVGWDGEAGQGTRPFTHGGMYLRPVGLSTVEIEEFYEGFSNDTLWPIYHDVIVQPSFHRDWWRAYVEVNQRFADAGVEVAAEGATVWVQDYQLQLVPRMVRQQRPDLRIGWFNHIPFRRRAVRPDPLAPRHSRGPARADFLGSTSGRRPELRPVAGSSR